MNRRAHRPRKSRHPWRVGFGCLGAAALLFAAAPTFAQPDARARAVPVASALRLPALGAEDAGALPVSTPLRLTLNLALTSVQRDDLNRLLASQTEPAANDFRHWLTPAQFAARFGVSDQALAALNAWLGARGLTVESVSPSRRRMVVTGSAIAVERAFAVSLRTYRSTSRDFYATKEGVTLPTAVSGTIQSISGLSDVAADASARITVLSGAAPSRARAVPEAQTVATSTAATTGSLDILADLIEGNANPVLTLASTACSGDFEPADIDTVRALLEQAAAQGITVLAGSGCSASVASTAFPASLSNALAFTEGSTAAGLEPSAAGLDARPRWQVAQGLPTDDFRREPDLATTSGPALAATVSQLLAQSGTRLGNINSTLYALSKVQGLYTQPDDAPAGTWEPGTGLGVVDLQKLVKVFPRISGISTKTSLISSTYAVNYGNPFTLTSSIQVTGVIPPGTTPYPSAPSGVVTFTASTQGVLGTASIDGSGTATLDSGVLPVGTYVLTAAYSGDASYAPSTSTSNVTITVSLVSAKLTATASPSTNIPYGAAATITATVTLPGSSAAPTGPVTAQISSGTPVSATLSPNPGSNSATANIDVSVPPPGSYNVHVTCEGTTNFQCQTPVNLPITVVKGYTTTTVSVTPAAPQAGQPISLTATVGNSGNGTASYTYGGSITFYDSGKLLAVAPVATNQATTTVTLSGNRTHNLTATYTGDANWNGSTSQAVAVSPTILPDALTLSSNVSGNSSLAGVNIIFTGTVTTTITYQSGPTGTLTFFDTFNGAVVQLGNPAVLVANGSAASIALFTTTGLAPGTHRIYVQYSGDDNYAPATSAVLQLSLSDFSLTLTPASLTVAQGKSAQVSVLVGNSGGFDGTVSLGCTPPSGSEATCTFAPASVTGTGGTTLTIVTAIPNAKGGTGRAVAGNTGWTIAGGSALATLLWITLPRRRLPTLLALLLASTMTGVLGCGTGLVSSGDSGSNGGGGGGSSTSDPGTPLGTQNYIITAAGSDGVNVVRHTVQYQVTIQ